MAATCSGILRAFADIVMDTLWPAARELGRGTDWVNQHPIVTVCLDKLASLNRSQCLCNDNMRTFNRAYDEVVKLAAGDNREIDTAEPPTVHNVHEIQ